MSNTPSDDVLFELIKEHFGLEKRPFDTVIDRKTGKFHDAARYRDFAAAVLAKWGTPQQVAQEPIATQWLAEMIMSDCGCSTQNQHLLDRIVERITHYDAANTAPQPAPAPLGDDVVRNAAFEAVRKKLCALPRYSFVLDDDGLVRRVQNRTGNWIEFDDAHELFDPVAVDAALAAQGGK